MRRNFRSLLVAVSIVFSHSCLASEKFCAPAELNLLSAREIIDGKDLSYLFLLTRPYISTNSEQGLLSAYEFSSDGRTFNAKVNQSLKWRDGSKLSARQALEGISNSLPFRALGKRVKVKGSNIISSSEFKITFESTVKNISGLIIEALSSGSRQNRMWPNKKNGAEIETLSKYPYVVAGKTVILTVFDKEIKVVSKKECDDVSHTIYPELLKTDKSNFLTSKSPLGQAITLQINSKRVSLSRRRKIACWVRSAFDNSDPLFGITSVERYFLEGEAGYSAKRKSLKCGLGLENIKNISLAAEIPAHQDLITKKAQLDGVQITWKKFPLVDTNVDAQVLSSAIQKGRQVIFQDLLDWNYVLDLLKACPKTTASLRKIANFSASTVPPNDQTLSSFQTSSDEEWCLSPIGRRFSLTFSKNNSSVQLEWDDRAELHFVAKKT